jgi:hypothetical protein
MIAQGPGFDRAQLRAYAAYSVLRQVLDSPAPGRVRAAAYRTLSSAPGLRILRRDGDRVLLATRVGDVEFRRASTPATAACSPWSASCCAAASRSRAHRGSWTAR